MSALLRLIGNSLSNTESNVSFQPLQRGATAHKQPAGNANSKTKRVPLTVISQRRSPFEAVSCTRDSPAFNADDEELSHDLQDCGLARHATPVNWTEQLPENNHPPSTVSTSSRRKSATTFMFTPGEPSHHCDATKPGMGTWAVDDSPVPCMDAHSRQQQQQHRGSRRKRIDRKKLQQALAGIRTGIDADLAALREERCSHPLWLETHARLERASVIHRREHKSATVANVTTGYAPITPNAPVAPPSTLIAAAH